MARGVILDEKAFLALKREVQSLRLSVRATVARKRAVRIHSPIGGSGAYRWARTRSGGIPAATYNDTGGSESLGLMTAGSALCDLLNSNNDGTYEIQAGEEETVFNGVTSAIAGDTIIGVIQHSDGQVFVIVEDCPPGERCDLCVQVPSQIIHADISTVALGTCSTPECNALEGTKNMTLVADCRWGSALETFACVGDFTLTFRLIALTGNDVTAQLLVATTGPPAETNTYEQTVDITTKNCATGLFTTFTAADLIGGDNWTLCDLTGISVAVTMSPAP